MVGVKVNATFNNISVISWRSVLLVVETAVPAENNRQTLSHINVVLNIPRQSGIRVIDDDVRFVPDQHTEMDLYSASSLKQQFAGRHVDPLGHIILILSQPSLCSFSLRLRT